jgi:hypothetical protein
MALNVPLTGSMAKGPLGLVHLPRMWQKALLKKTGVLPDDYVFAERGFDQRMMEAVGIDPAAFLPFLETLPTYLETEAWVRAHATKLGASEASNAGIVNHAMRPESSQKLRAAMGIADATYDNGAELNNLDDLVTLQHYLVGRRGRPPETIVPSVSSLATGPLGVLHLARLWAKAVIKAAAELPEGYHSGKGPLDEQLAETIGMDLPASVRFTEELPSYIAYEAWVREHATKLDPATVAAWNERMRTREKPEHVAAPEREILGITDANERRGVMLNDVLDWHYVHEQITAPRSSAA